jgi:RNA polymerase sigma-70 factor (ECF subfamily)
MAEHARFDQWVLPHLDAGYNLARWLARDPHDAQDVVQEACLRALKYADSLRPDGSRSWFLTIVRHAFYDWQRRNRPQEVVHEGDALLAALADPGAADPEGEAMRKDDARLLAQALARLPVSLREVLILREMEELSYKEIARVVGVPVGTVMSRLARARELLQRLAQPRTGGPT